MKTFFKESTSVGLARSNMLRLLTSRNFITAVCLGLAVIFTTFLSQSFEGGMLSFNGVCEELYFVLIIGFIGKLLVLVSSLSAVTDFCTDWNSQYTIPVASKTGAAKYARHKVYACIATTFITSFAILSIFSLILMTFMPITTEISSWMNDEPLFGSVYKISPFLYNWVRIICYSSFCTIWSTLGLTFSAILPNRYLVYASPFVLYYVFERWLYDKIYEFLTPWLQLPDLALAFNNNSSLFGNALLNFLYINLLFIGIALLIGTLFVYCVKRRMQNEMV